MSRLPRSRPLLGPDDLVIDAGNANFHDTNRRAARWPAVPLPRAWASRAARRARATARRSWAAARAQDWDRMAPVLQAIAARAEDGTPCADQMGPAGAGHFVKAVHNGIEYADMQMIAEVYGVMRDGLGMTAAADRRRRSRAGTKASLQSYLIEISAEVAAAADPVTGRAAAGRDPRRGGPEGHRPLDRDRGAAPGRPDPGDRGRGDGAQRLGPAGRTRGGRGALWPRARSRPTGADAGRSGTGADRRQDPLLCAGLRDDDRGRGRLRLGAADCPPSRGSGARAASSARRC